MFTILHDTNNPKYYCIWNNVENCKVFGPASYEECQNWMNWERASRDHDEG